MPAPQSPTNLALERRAEERALGDLATWLPRRHFLWLDPGPRRRNVRHLQVGDYFRIRTSGVLGVDPHARC